MMKMYEETFSVRVRDCDINGQWRPGAILESMQEAAGIHSELLGCGRDELLRRDIVWVLSRCELRMERYPHVGETVTISTFPVPTRLYFFPRYFIIRDSGSNIIGRAGSLWLLLDLNTRKMLPPGDVGKMIPDNSDLPVPMSLPATVGALQGTEFVSEYHPVYTDLDANGHVNNARYADWLCNSLGTEIMMKSEFASIIINFSSEIRPDDTVELRKTLRDEEFTLHGSCSGRKAFDIGGSLRTRQISGRH